MRKLFIIALGLAGIGALVAAESASAGTRCVPVNCHTYYGTGGPVTTCDKSCTPVWSGQVPGTMKVNPVSKRGPRGPQHMAQ
jgi:hypothetical protein